ncbi:MAG TPA: type IV pilus modification protein PilV [Xanthomonadaceae bacterium]|nr:type IV pilus modification protein PilV [Xanthomonadaceae bacterium]
MHMKGFRGATARQRGFTLIEVMIALLILGVGLLGFALLQTMNVRFTKSAQQRTVASNLAYEVVDIMRTQRSMGSYFNGVTYASFDDVDPDTACARDTDAGPEANIARWKCEVSSSLPDGRARIVLAPDGNLTVSIRWGDQHWESEADDQLTTFEVKSRI